MKKQIKIFLMFMLIILIFSLNNKVDGAIAIKEAGTSVLTGKTISEFFDMAQQMKDPGQALEGTELDPHMATNKEWAAVSYLSNSNYGTGGAGQNNGMTVTINGNSHYSTNDNITGVIDWGRNVSFTAGILSEADTKITDETIKANGQSLIENMENSSRVDSVDYNKNDWESLYAGRDWYDTETRGGINFDWPYTSRHGLLGLKFGNAFRWIIADAAVTSGARFTYVTFRPVL